MVGRTVGEVCVGWMHVVSWWRLELGVNVQKENEAEKGVIKLGGKIGRRRKALGDVINPMCLLAVFNTAGLQLESRCRWNLVSRPDDGMKHASR